MYSTPIIPHLKNANSVKNYQSYVALRALAEVTEKPVMKTAEFQKELLDAYKRHSQFLVDEFASNNDKPDCLSLLALQKFDLNQKNDITMEQVESKALSCKRDIMNTLMVEWNKK